MVELEGHLIPRLSLPESKCTRLSWCDAIVRVTNSSTPMRASPKRGCAASVRLDYQCSAKPRRSDNERSELMTRGSM